MPSTAPRANTGPRILDVAQRLVQTRGFNAFSYGDIAKDLGITTASLHYHFPTKSDLGTALIARYEHQFLAALAAIEGDAGERLRAYAGLYGSVLRDGRICLCGMLAAELQTLPPPMQAGLTHFFDANEAWLAATVEAGRADGTLIVAGDTRDTARLVLDALEGAMMLAMAYRDPARFDAAADRLLAALGLAATADS